VMSIPIQVAKISFSPRLWFKKLDFNGDGTIDLNDILTIDRMFQGFADLNGDKTLNAQDLTELEKNYQIRESAGQRAGYGECRYQ